MGDLQVVLRQSGDLTEEIPLPPPPPPLPPSPPLSWPHPSLIGADSWKTGEKAAHDIVCRIQPTVVSEQRRKAVIEYVQRLIRQFLGSEVFPFGSVPLKTYLPDGDIDLTALGNQNFEDALANDLCSVLEGEEQNKDAEFEVKEIQYIHAEVKLVKCIIQNIVVDISFNQLGGLCTLCFLEQVDRLIGKNHLFKRSIILIKAWCYYESRILGAHHGLISTYALETLVLYIFHRFHSCLHGPLEVLYRFLDYFSKFDWDNYGISLNGPIAVSSLPDIVAETSEDDGGDVLLNKEFLRSCVDMFSVPSRGLENNTRIFPQKHLNIVDPLRENNNLGRSVSKGNLYRIRSAFSFGARKLGRILLLSGENMVDELKKFFLNTLDRHGSGKRPDVQEFWPGNCDSNPYSANGSGSAILKSDYKKYEESRATGDGPEVLSREMSGISISESSRPSSSHRAGSEQPELENKLVTQNQSEKHLSNHEPVDIGSQTHLTLSEPVRVTESNVVSCSRMAGDAKDLATSQNMTPRITTYQSNPSSPSNELHATSPGRVYHAPHLYFSRPFQETDKFGDGSIDRLKLTEYINSEDRMSFDSHAAGEQPDHERKYSENDAFLSGGKYVGYTSPGSDALSSGTPYHAKESSDCPESRDVGALNASFKERDLVGASRDNTEASNSLSELSGDYESHFNSLIYVRWCHEFILCGPVMPFPQQFPSHYRNKSSWDRRSSSMKQNAFQRTNANGVVPGPVFPTSGYYPMNRPVVSGAYGMEENQKPRGTGTYFPNMNHQSYRDRQLWRDRNPMPTGPSPTAHNQMRPRNGRLVGPTDAMNFSDKGGNDILPQTPGPPPPPPVAGMSIRGKSSPTDIIPSSHTAVARYPQNNGSALPTDGLAFGSFGPVQLMHVTTAEQVRPVVSSAFQRTQGSGSGSALLRLGSNLNQERAQLSQEAQQQSYQAQQIYQAQQAYQLKDEADFPPLSSRALRPGRV